MNLPRAKFRAEEMGTPKKKKLNHESTLTEHEASYSLLRAPFVSVRGSLFRPVPVL